MFFDADDDGVQRGEINVMIAVESARRIGIAREAILLFMHYAFVRLHIRRFMCKINELNEASRSLFVKYICAVVLVSKCINKLFSGLVLKK